jgi:hypothetical protein
MQRFERDRLIGGQNAWSGHLDMAFHCRNEIQLWMMAAMKRKMSIRMLLHASRT